MLLDISAVHLSRSLMEGLIQAIIRAAAPSVGGSRPAGVRAPGLLPDRQRTLVAGADSLRQLPALDFFLSACGTALKAVSSTSGQLVSAASL